MQHGWRCLVFPRIGCPLDRVNRSFTDNFWMLGKVCVKVGAIALEWQHRATEWQSRYIAAGWVDQRLEQSVVWECLVQPVD